MQSNSKQKNVHILTRRDIVKLRYFEEKSPEKKLWKGVICQAIEDATTKSRKGKARYAKRRAERWLTSNNPDFKEVCEYAGCSPKIVKDNVVRLINSSSQGS